MFIDCSQLSSQHTETTVEFLLQHVDVHREQNDCNLQICITPHDDLTCIHNIQCSVTVANSHAKPVLLQWIPLGDYMGHLIISNYNEKVAK